MISSNSDYSLEKTVAMPGAKEEDLKIAWRYQTLQEKSANVNFCYFKFTKNY